MSSVEDLFWPEFSKFVSTDGTNIVYDIIFLALFEYVLSWSIRNLVQILAGALTLLAVAENVCD